MQKVAIVTDSLACLTRELVERYRIGIVPLNVHFEGKVYKDWVDITPSEAYELFLKNPDAFGTSAPSPDDYLEGFREASRRVNNILCVTISAKLSTTYDVAHLAKKYAEKELHGVNIDVLDSNTTTAAEGFVALAAARAADGGQDLTETARAAVEMRDKVRVLILLDTIRHIYRSGRIPKVAAQVGSLLNFRPILSVEGGVRFIGVVRSREGGIERMLRAIRSEVGSNPVHVAVMHAYAAEEAERLKERVSCEFNCAELWVTEFSPIMGYACGTGTLGLAFYPED